MFSRIDLCKRFLSFLVVLSAFTLTFGQQEPTKPVPKNDSKPPAAKADSLPITVKLNLWVLNKDEKAVNNLSAEQFSVFEDDVEQKVKVVEQRSGPLKLILLVDNSGSMRSVLAQVVRAGNFFIDHLEDADQCEIIRFVSSSTIQEAQKFTSDKVLLKKTLDAMYVEGGQSAVIDALYLASEKLQSVTKDYPSARSAIVIISDGEDRSSFYTQKDLVSSIEKSGTPIFFIQPSGAMQPGGLEKSAKLVNYISLLTGGSVHPVSAPADYLLEVASISLEMRAPYVVTYASTNTEWDGKSRKVRVEVKGAPADEKLVVVARAGYTVPKR